MIVAYDFDGVLSEKPPASEKKWGRMNGEERRKRKDDLLKFYMTAPQLLIPEETSFHVITARKNDPDVTRISLHWLRMRFPMSCESVHFLGKSRSIKNVVEFKSSVLLKLGAEKFIEDNMTVLKGLMPIVGHKIKLVYYDKKGQLNPLN